MMEALVALIKLVEEKEGQDLEDQICLIIAIHLVCESESKL